METSKNKDILERVLRERDSELKMRAREAEVKEAEKLRAEAEKKKMLITRLEKLNKAVKIAQLNISELAQDQEIKRLILDSLLQNCKKETIERKAAFNLIKTDGLALNHVYPNDGFNDVYLFLDEDLTLCVAYLRYMSHEYGYSSRSEEKLCLDSPRNEDLRHIEYHLHHIWRDKLIPGVLKALSDKKSAIEFFVNVLPDQKHWWEKEEHDCFARSIDHILQVWHGQPLLKIC